MKLSELLKDVEVLHGDICRDVTKIAVTSKDVEKNTLFISVKGYGKDSSQFTEEARNKGAIILRSADEKGSENDIVVADAVAARNYIWRNRYNDPAEKLDIFGVTGTNGKTTVTYLVRHILDSLDIKTGIIGTVANITGDETVSSVQTTPAPDELYRLLDKMRNNGLSSVAMEVSSHSLSQNRVGALNFKAAALTNITQDHLDFHGSMANYADAKKKLVPLSKSFAINKDDSYAELFIEEAKKYSLPYLLYGISSDCDIKAERLYLNRSKTTFTVNFNGRKIQTEINIPGRFSVYNALTAISLCTLGGLDPEKCCDAIRTAVGVKGRMERIPLKNGATVIIDYAHTPDGLEKVLITLRDLRGKGRIITVFGCGGDRDKTKRPLMGEIAANYSDLVIVTDDNPRSEDPYAIISDILKGNLNRRTPLLIIEDRKAAIETAVSNSSKDDIILLAGKGHETYQIIKDKTLNFDEREIIKAYI